MRYVISDLHGHYQTFKGMLEKINFSQSDVLYILGDVIDRGPEPMKILNHIMGAPNIHMLLGNHEDMMLSTLHESENEVHRERWYRNGGEITYYQFKQLEKNEKACMINYLEKLPLYIDLEEYLLVHAGVKVAEDIIYPTWEDVKGFQTKKDLVWIREEFYTSSALKDKKVIFGHTPTHYIGNKGKIWFDEDKIGIDCGICSGTLGCLNIDTLEVYYMDNLELQDK